MAKENTSVLPTQYQSFIHLSRYSRFNWEEGRRETWEETVQRWTTFFAGHALNFVEGTLSTKKVNETMDQIQQAIKKLDVMPSMRTMMTAGPALARDNIAAYNCSFLAIDRVQSFDELLYILMNGTGVGFSVERQFVTKLPVVAEEFHKSDIVIAVQDSKLGWAKALKELISLLYQGQIPSWDVSKVRTSGAPLMTFGGRASGPEPLVDLFRFAVDTFKKAAGRKLTSIECHDLVCKIADSVVVGGVRRSALISLSNLSDDRLRAAKAGQWWENYPHRRLANNSAAYTEKPEIGIFMDEWKSLYDSKSGERGIFNREAAKKKCESIGRDPNFDFGTNPCFTGDTLVWTAYGPKRFDEIAGLGTIPVLTQLHDGTIAYRDMIRPRMTQRNAELIEVRIKTGPHRKAGRIRRSSVKESVVRCTPNHVFYLSDGSSKMAKDLLPGDSIYSCYQRKLNSKGYLKLDGAHDSVNAAHAVLEWKYGRKPSYPEEHAHHLDENKTNNDPDNVVIKDASHHNHDHMVGDRNPMRRFPEANWTKRPGAQAKKSNGRWRKEIDTDAIRNMYESGASIKSICDTFNCTHTLIYRRLSLGQYAENHTVVGVKSLTEREDVYCGTVPSVGRFFVWCAENEGVLVSNCGEILLRDREFCNLSEVVIRSDDDMDSLKEKVRLATIIGTLQSTLTDFRYISKKWKENCEEERLLGVSLTGIMDSVLTNGKKSGLDTRLAELRQVARETNAEWAKLLGIPESKAITCVKPSGTVSQLVNSGSGIHARHSRYYVRRARMDSKDPMASFMRESGFPLEADVMAPDHTLVASFPIESPAKAVFRDDMTAIEQLELWHVYRQHWCDHNPSITVTVREHEWMEVGAWVYKHFDDMTGVSFLPHSDHVYRQAPYEEIDEAAYKALVAKMPINVEWEGIAKYEGGRDNTTGTQELNCSAGGCEIV